jgi:hypothetical protein
VSRIYFRINGLASPGAARAPRLERALARAGRSTAVHDWREQAFRLLATESAGMPGIAAAPLCGELGIVDAASVFMASPVHCEAGMVSVRLPANGLIGLTAEEALQLAQEFNRDFDDGAQRLIAAPSGRLFCSFCAATTALTHDPLTVRGRDIGPLLPAGADGPRLRRLMSEIEMWLFEHALNRARVARGAMPVTGLWLWGGGAPLAQLPTLTGWTAGDDVLFGAWPRQQDFPRQPRSGVIVLEVEPGTAAWQAAQGEWLVPALTALRRGRIRQLDLGIGERQFALRAGWSLRFWRRARPWWEYSA